MRPLLTGASQLHRAEAEHEVERKRTGKRGDRPGRDRPCMQATTEDIIAQNDRGPRVKYSTSGSYSCATTQLPSYSLSAPCSNNNCATLRSLTCLFDVATWNWVKLYVHVRSMPKKYLHDPKTPILRCSVQRSTVGSTLCVDNSPCARRRWTVFQHRCIKQRCLV